MDGLKFNPLPFPSPLKIPGIEPAAEQLATAFEHLLLNYEGKTESAGPNRSEWVDEINHWIGVPMGSPYCLSGILFNLRKLEDQFSIKFDLPNFASTQLFWLGTKKEFKTSDPGRFQIGIFRSIKDPTHGHAVYSMGPAIAGAFKTFEFNTNLAGSRDGGGAMSSERLISGSAKLQLLGFVDLFKSLT